MDMGLLPFLSENYVTRNIGRLAQVMGITSLSGHEHDGHKYDSLYRSNVKLASKLFVAKLVQVSD
jgi:hypothetical protein